MTRAKLVILLCAILVLTAAVTVDIIVRTRPVEPSPTAMTTGKEEGTTDAAEKQSKDPALPVPAAESSPTPEIRPDGSPLAEVPSAEVTPVAATPVAAENSPIPTSAAVPDPTAAPDATAAPVISAGEDDGPPKNESPRDTT